MTMPHKLLVSFWDIGLENLPEGAFTRRRLTADAAQASIRQARASGGLLCVCREDILAPYGQRARDRHAALCAVLREQFDIDLTPADFCGRESDEDGALTFINPLNCVTVDADRALLVVTCGYVLGDRTAGGGGMLPSVIAPSSVAFHLIAVA